MYPRRFSQKCYSSPGDKSGGGNFEAAIVVSNSGKNSNAKPLNSLKILELARVKLSEKDLKKIKKISTTPKPGNSKPSQTPKQNQKIQEIQPLNNVAKDYNPKGLLNINELK